MTEAAPCLCWYVYQHKHGAASVKSHEVKPGILKAATFFGSEKHTLYVRTTEGMGCLTERAWNNTAPYHYETNLYLHCQVK